MGKSNTRKDLSPQDFFDVRLIERLRKQLRSCLPAETCIGFTHFDKFSVTNGIFNPNNKVMLSLSKHCVSPSHLDRHSVTSEFSDYREFLPHRLENLRLKEKGIVMPFVMVITF